jgi:hypothetical protein
MLMVGCYGKIAFSLKTNCKHFANYLFVGSLLEE